ncbi:glycosyltransferase [Sphingomicrobium aestuariivivum]|uniref:glycosyltransferase n=1 Tax=Sphingomicrobium aestuariivivum TaxID=1582356 RepID=UPI001FD6C060|nr:glycosyltransferase [Sphingomicrobium aestuariivivum]MCJ8191962.1 glycosyltransferase [Sphingomicrobium aestuariivivum]
MSDRRKILIFVNHFPPAFKSGGPVRSVANIVEALGEDHDIHVVTTDRDRGDARPFDHVTSDRWNSLSKAKVWFASPGSLDLGTVSALIDEVAPDLIHTQSFFASHFSILPQLAAWRKCYGADSILVGPRGEFSQGALGLKAVKKRAYLALWKLLGLWRRVRFHASDAHEARDIARLFPKASVSKARDIGPGPTDVPLVAGIDGEPLKVLFLSRIAPMKNLDFALEALARCREPIAFTICGPVDDAAYWERCDKLVDKLPGHVAVTIEGPVAPPDIPAKFAAHELFFLPTRGENYGHVIAEAFASGAYTLISDRTPWTGLEVKEAGRTLALEDGPEAFALAIDAFARKSADERLAMRKAIRAVSPTLTGREEAIAEHHALYASGAQSAPDQERNSR